MKPEDQSYAISLKGPELDDVDVDALLDEFYYYFRNNRLGATYASDSDGEGRYNICFFMHKPDVDMSEVIDYCKKFPDSWDLKIIKI